MAHVKINWLAEYYFLLHVSKSHIIILHLHLFILQMLLSNVTYNWGIQ